MDQHKKGQETSFSEFPPVSKQQWEEKIIKDLKGANYEKKLMWRTEEGFNLKPYYRAEDLKQLEYLDTLPGDFPFTRGNEIKTNDWLIRQDIAATNANAANQKALDIIKRGITSVGFSMKKIRPSLENIAKLLKDINIEDIEIDFTYVDSPVELMNSFNGFVLNRNFRKNKIKGSVDYDFLAELTLYGNFRKSEKEDTEEASRLLKFAREFPHFRTITVNGAIFKNAGSTITQELAFSLAMANEYIARMIDLGYSIDEVAKGIKFHFAVGSKYFLEIAKIRAARILWANIIKAYEPQKEESSKMHVFTETTNWNKTIYDPYVNMLRTTTEAMSAIIGGTDSLLVHGYDKPFKSPVEFAERVARNQQLIIKEESYFDKVVDPGAGSYYIENLTHSFINEAWKTFLEIDDMGGYLEALKKGYIQKQIRESANAKDMAIASRKEIILGTNQYPNSSEKMDEGFDLSDIESKEMHYDDAIVETIKPYRGAEEFEKLRFKTDRYARDHKRPVVFMLTIGNLAMRRARAQFSGNFFACAGYEILDNNGFKTAEEGVKAATDAGADIVVVCSSDEEYAEIAPQAKEEIKDNAIVAVAGYPKNIADALQAKGIDKFIHIKSNVLQTLKEFQKELGIE